MKLNALEISSFTLEEVKNSDKQLFNLKFESKHKIDDIDEVLILGNDRFIILNGYHYTQMKEHYYSYNLKYYN